MHSAHFSLLTKCRIVTKYRLYTAEWGLGKKVRVRLQGIKTVFPSYMLHGNMSSYIALKKETCLLSEKYFWMRILEQIKERMLKFPTFTIFLLVI